MNRKFQRRIEDFTCENCLFETTGDGYTNHCPSCLYSKHVDVHPGDRAAQCRGLMEPISAKVEHGEKRILHRCTVCNFERWQRAGPMDNEEILLMLLCSPKGTGNA